MMVFSMRYYKKIRQIFLICLLAAFTTSAFAENSSIHIEKASLDPLDDYFVLNADVEMKFSEKVEEAISKGFEFNFLIEFQLAKPNKYWFDDEVVTTTHEISLSYHALSRQFLVIRGDQQKTFVRLDEALDDLSDIANLRVFHKHDVEKGELYKAALLMRLNSKKLPKTLQGEALGSDDWKMSSQRLEWTPSLFK